MCGLAGKINYNLNRSVNFFELKQMTETIIHRGPDDEGYFINNSVGLGFRRLSILDLKSGHQPLCDNSKRYWITYNGEVYNYQELRFALSKKGYFFKTTTDTEVIVNLYAEYKEKCLEFMRGMFAFVIWDNQNKILFGARDRFGIKPLHYYRDDKRFIWASEIKSILTCDKTNRKLSLEALDYYFAYGYTPREQSIFKHIKKLKPGHFFVLKPFENQEFTIKSYWKIKFSPDYSRSESYWKDSIYKTMNNAVKMRMISDVPLGAFLSGGIDSSIIVSLMALNSSKSIKTFSIGFKEMRFNELKYARLVANKYETDHHELIIEPESIDLLSKLVCAYDEPFADSSAIPTYYVSKFAREHVTVSLSGDCGDELFAGYNDYTKMIALNKLLFSNRFTEKAIFCPLNKILPDHIYGKGLSYFLSKPKNDIGAYFTFWKDYERRQVFLPEISKQIDSNAAEKLKLDLLKKMNGDFLSKMQHLDMQTYMVDDILTKVERASMLNSLEARIPFLDHKFAELSFKIPHELKLKGKNKKYILKEAFRQNLPPEILVHKKHGFSMPLRVWFKDNLRDFAYDSLTHNSFLDDYLDINCLKKKIDDHQKGMRDYSRQIWSLLFLNEWLKQMGTISNCQPRLRQ